MLLASSNLFGGGVTSAAATTEGHSPSYGPASPADLDPFVWSSVGSGVGGYVFAVAVSGSDIYVGGEFTIGGGSSANNIARWDGANWSALGSGVDGKVEAIAVSGGNVYVGGYFANAGGAAAYNVARWDGSDWSPLGNGVDDEVYALLVSGSDIYAGGYFLSAGGAAADNIARWDGSTWSPLGIGTNGGVFALTADGTGGILVGGDFTTAGGNAVYHVAKWDGVNWSALSSPVSEGPGSGSHGGSEQSLGATVFSVVAVGADLYAAGQFSLMGDISADNIAKWKGTSWSQVGSGTDRSVRSLAVRSSSREMMVGGVFATAGGLSSPCIARFSDHGNTILPIQLASFTGQYAENVVRLHWLTLSEINDYGFYVQRRHAADSTWVVLPGSFVPGHGTTNQPHEYALTDRPSGEGLWQYRLKQVDLDGSVHFTDPIAVDVTTGVDGTASSCFVLEQNYPNPFNPATNIRFAVPVGASRLVSLRLFDVLGREVATLVHAEMGPGAHEVVLDGSSLAGGTYFYRLDAGILSSVKRMLLIK